MSGIDQLSIAPEFTAGMQVPVYDGANSQPRRVSGQQVLEFVQGNLQSDTSAPFRLIELTVAELAAYPAAAWKNGVVVCSNGNAGARCLAVSDGSNWLRVALGAAVSAT